VIRAQAFIVLQDGFHAVAIEAQAGHRGREPNAPGSDGLAQRGGQRIVALAAPEDLTFRPVARQAAPSDLRQVSEIDLSFQRHAVVRGELDPQPGAGKR